MQVRVIAFGPLAEQLGGKEHDFEIPPSSSVRFLIEEIGIEMWLSHGLSISVNGNKVGEDEPLVAGDEVALLPPVSGG
jgi:molybdopterin converting factor small subunit